MEPTLTILSVFPPGSTRDSRGHPTVPRSTVPQDTGHGGNAKEQLITVGIKVALQLRTVPFRIVQRVSLLRASYCLHNPRTLAPPRALQLLGGETLRVNWRSFPRRQSQGRVGPLRHGPLAIWAERLEVLFVNECVLSVFVIHKTSDGSAWVSLFVPFCVHS